MSESETDVDSEILEHALAEYRAARTRVQDSVDVIFERRAADLACVRGCSSCCVDGLTVVDVEAAEISLHLQTRALAAATCAPSRAPSRPQPPPGGCHFLDVDGGCTIYEVRPFVCRTHGLPLRMPSLASRGSLRVVDDVAVCSLNFVDEEFHADDVLDAERIQMLLSVVNSRFCQQLGVDDDGTRVALADLATLPIS